QFDQIGILSLFRMIVFDGTFYHLWYFPALIIGSLLLYLLSRKVSFAWVLAIALVLYVIGLLGDSYFGVTKNIPVISSLYDTGFHLYSYTRNGLFYTPVFLALGAWFGHSPKLCKKNAAIVCFSACMILMATEGLTLHHFGLQRHDSMYLALLPCMFFLFQLLLSWNVASAHGLRAVSIWIYLIHPFMIVAVRGVAKLFELSNLLVENSLLQYLSVCALSVLFAILVAKLPPYHKRKVSFRSGRAWIELDRNALRHNVEMLRSLLPDGCKLMPAVKANAYGHGAVLISKELNTMGIKAFCVASLLEGIELRRNGIQGEILVLGYTSPEFFSSLCRYRLTQTVIGSSYAQVLNQYGKTIKVQIAIDTGMHRLGVRCERVDEIAQIFQYKNLKIEGIFTHLCADETKAPEDQAFTMAQGHSFFDVVAQLNERGYRFLKLHLQASYGLLNYPELGGDYARVGIALYGLLSTCTDTEKSPISLKPVLSVKARVACVKDLYEGETAGYGLSYVANQDTKIAVIAIGYADGIPRSLSCGVGAVLINGYEAPIIGRICMDQTLVDISGIPDVQAGDIAVLIGRDGNKEITACDLAKQAGTISNEILSRLGERLERQLV
ncbi:MAG: alanine racemase, partial [Evtepia sp.]|nr:alanine racemase [Evtepia sp.]